MALRGEASARFEKINEAATATPRRSWRVHHDGAQLQIIFMDPELALPPQVLDLTNWLALGDCSTQVAEAFARHYVSKRRTTRFNSSKSFYYGFVQYACNNGIKLHQPSDAHPNILKNFLIWLSNYNGYQKPTDKQENQESIEGAKKASPWTRIHLWAVCKAVFNQLLRNSPDGMWVVEIPKKPFAGEKFIPAGKKAVDLKLYIDFLASAADEAIDLIDTVQPHFKIIADAVKRIQSGGVYDPTKIDDVVAKVLIDYDWIVPERKYLQKFDPDTFRDVSMHGFTNVCRLAHPQFSDLIPFLYLVASHTGFNQQPLTYIRLGQIIESSILGVTRISLSPEKYRSGTILRRSFVRTEEKLSVARLIDFIVEWTVYIRRIAPHFAKEDLWIFANKMKSGADGNHPVRSLASQEKNNQNEISNHIRRYCERKRFKFTGLREIRFSFSDLFLRARPGDLEGLRILLGQKWISTTADHYRSTHAFADGQELLAGAMSMQQRWIGSGGKVDTRSTGEKRERTAATPGFICLDPFDSPVPGQQKGRLCGAYGKCPGCALAASDADSSYALARFFQLAEEYEKAKARLGSEVWSRKYHLCADALISEWIPGLTTPTSVAGAQKINLPRLPELE